MTTANENPDSILSGRGTLRPKARLLRTLGSDLISSDKVALIELVKNSYDADASMVLIRFYGPLNEGEGRIEVWDDGCGMDVETLQKSWLDIATDMKKKNPHTRGGRRVLGEKGIGRLAAARLSEEMLLTTKRLRSDEIELLINWRDFDREDAYLDEIEVAWNMDQARVFSDDGAAAKIFGNRAHRGQGTVLRLSKLTRRWTRTDLLEVRTALTRLIRPRPDAVGGVVISQEESAVDFQIVLELTDVDEGILDLAGVIESPTELRTPHYRLSGKVDSEGIGILQYNQQDPQYSEFVESISLWKNQERPPRCGPFLFDISVWDRDNRALRKLFRSENVDGISPSVDQLRGFRDTLDELAGVSIYRDGFRVLPFGEKGDDWLGLDLRRVNNPTLRISNNQVIGHIFIGADSNQELQDQSNREGLLVGDAYIDLQQLVRSALNELEQRRYGARRTNQSERVQRGGLFDRFSLGEVRTELAQRYPGDKKLIGLVDAKDLDIQKGVEEVQNVLSRFSRLATLGALIDRVLHDGRTVITRLKNIVRFATRDLDKETLNDNEKLRIALESFDASTEQVELLSALFKQIEPFGGRRRGRPKKVNVGEVISKTISTLQNEADEHAVELEGDCVKIVVRIDDGELLSVLLNLVQNAIYWTSQQPEGVERIVRVGARMNEDGSLTVVVSDSGPGVAEGVRQQIFDPYFSCKPDGIGLGLSIAGNIVENIYDGELVLLEEGVLKGATFEATFRRRV